MKPKRLKSFIFIIGLIAVTGVAMAYSTGAGKTWLSGMFRPATHPHRASPLNA